MAAIAKHHTVYIKDLLKMDQEVEVLEQVQMVEAHKLIFLLLLLIIMYVQEYSRIIFAHFISMKIALLIFNYLLRPKALIKPPILLT